MFTLTLNGTIVTGMPGITILELAREHGVAIPTLCHHPKLSPLGACRLCLVEVQGSRTLVAACHTPVTPNMVIATHSLKVIEARRMVLELLFASHSGFCWACDKANRCELKQLAADLDVGLPAFTLPKRYFAMEDAGPAVVRDLTKCILCRRCVRACREIKGAGLLAVAYRGYQSKVVVAQDERFEGAACADCDVCVEVCPVGALTKMSDRFAFQKQGPPLLVTG